MEKLYNISPESASYSIEQLEGILLIKSKYKSVSRGHDTQHNDTQHTTYGLILDIQHRDLQHPLSLCVVVYSVVMLNVNVT